MDNILGKAKTYLEEKGIDTSNMTFEEIIRKYHELLEDESDIAEDVVEPVEEVSGVEQLLAENVAIIETLNEEQKALFKKLIDLIK
jgi:hypothetical protein